MQTSIESLARNAGSDIFDDPALRNMLEDHLTWLINHASTAVMPVTAHQIEVYDFDWIGLLGALNIHADLHWLVIRMNGGNSLTDVPETLRSLRVPDNNVIQNLTMLHSSTKRIK